MIEAVLVWLTYHPLLWRILNAVMMTICATFPMVAVNWRNPRETTPTQLLVSTSVFLILPRQLFNGAGWIATTLNYEWVIACDLVTMVAVIALVNRWAKRWWLYALSLLTTLYGANHEQSAVLLVVCLGLMLIYQLWQRQWGSSAAIGILDLIAILELVWIKLSPGNALRLHLEIHNHFPAFAHLSLLGKFKITYLSTLQAIFFHWQLVSIVFIFVVALVTVSKLWAADDNSLLGIAPLLPVATMLLCAPASPVITESNKLIGGKTAGVLLFVVAVCALLAILASMPERLDQVIWGLAFLAALAVRIIIMLAPSNPDPGDRTFIFTYFLLGMISLAMLNRTSLPLAVQSFANNLLIGVGIFNACLWLIS